MPQKIVKAKADYMKIKIMDKKGNSKMIWKQLKHLGYAKKSRVNMKTVLEIDNELCAEEKKVVLFFN